MSRKQGRQGTGGDDGDWGDMVSRRAAEGAIRIMARSKGKMWLKGKELGIESDAQCPGGAGSKSRVQEDGGCGLRRLKPGKEWAVRRSESEREGKELISLEPTLVRHSLIHLNTY